MARKKRRIDGVISAVIAIVVALGVCGAGPVSAEEGTGNMVFFKGGFMGMTSGRANGFFTDCGLGSTTCGQNDSHTGWYVGAGLDLVLPRAFGT
ncbi:hypothetical protein [Nitrospira sp. Nam80]